jgi:AraC family transcriptional regulator
VDIQVVERAPARVAYQRYTGPFGAPLGRFWRKTMSPWLADHGVIDCPRYGVVVDAPANPPGAGRYDACVELPAGLTLPDAAVTTIPGGRYAVTRFKGTAPEIGPAWSAFQAECAARQLAQDGTRLPFEHYPRGAPYDQRSGTLACELCMPVGS